MLLQKISPKKNFGQALEPHLTYTVSSHQKSDLRSPGNNHIVCNEDLSDPLRQYQSGAVLVSTHVPQHIPLAGKLQRLNGETTRRA